MNKEFRVFLCSAVCVFDCSEDLLRTVCGSNVLLVKLICYFVIAETVPLKTISSNTSVASGMP